VGDSTALFSVVCGKQNQLCIVSYVCGGRCLMSLRPYQVASLEAVRSRFVAGIHRQLIALPTGSGKTVRETNEIWFRIMSMKWR
jgi:type I site-specific restriction endonuclease